MANDTGEPSTLYNRCRDQLEMIITHQRVTPVMVRRVCEWCLDEFENLWRQIITKAKQEPQVEGDKN